MMKKVLSLVVALCLVLSMAACGGNKTTTAATTAAATTAAATTKAAETTAAETTEAGEVYTYFSLKDFDESKAEEISDTIYDAALGEYYECLQAAQAEVEDVSLRYVLMAIAEAKLMESAVYVPGSSQGGNYAISRMAPYTVGNCLWGVDADRYENAIVTTEFIKSEDREEMKKQWVSLKGTGTYLEWAKKFLTDKGYTLADAYTTTFTSAPKTWDALGTYRSADTEAIINGLDGLVEYDCEGTLQLKCAESYEVSADGLTYTFKIKKGIKWVDSQGREYAELTANDFVAGMKHLLDIQGGTEYLLEGVIKNASEYLSGEVTDFAEVGCEATDDYTLVYTLSEPISYFMTMLSYNPFFPMNQQYFESQGEAYGTTPDNILYNGAFLVTNFTDNAKIEWTANPTYYDADKLNIHTITWLYNDGSDATKAYNDAVAGTISGCGLNTEALQLAKADGNFEKYGYISGTDATSYGMFFNIYRTAYENFNDATVAVSGITDEEERERTVAAMQNVHFRRALAFGLDRAAYNAQTTGDELALVSVINSYTPGNFVALTEDVTIDINGKSTTFKAGTYYGEVMQAVIDSDGVEIQVWDPEGNSGDGSSAGFDGWYNVENAQAELAIAIEELATAGIVIDEDHPIHIEMSYPSVSTTYTNRANACKQSIEASLNGLVSYDLLDCGDFNGWYYNGYYCDYSYQDNYHVYDCSGWGPDYGDPQTYLNTLQPYGDMVHCIGVY